ncbi:hypothetical protein F5Y04DRAFT_274898 [Hypomontagnella monticulosa]|nr:hypothetical protein F5Y04DRAFT_274898 [Hypomontagnella monticulosa]
MSQTINLLASLEASLIRLMKDVERDELGAIAYQIFHNPSNNTYVLLERYSGQMALEAHNNSAHMAEAVKRSQQADDAEGMPEVQTLVFKAGFTRN